MASRSNVVVAVAMLLLVAASVGEGRRDRSRKCDLVEAELRRRCIQIVPPPEECCRLAAAYDRSCGGGTSSGRGRKEEGSDIGRQILDRCEDREEDREEGGRRREDEDEPVYIKTRSYGWY